MKGSTPHEKIDRLFTMLDSGTPIQDIMRADERARGRRVIVPGEVSWFPIAEWLPSSVVSIDGDVVRLIAIIAMRPGCGAFRRLIGGIQAAGLTPMIVEPSQEMRTTLKRWGWKGRREGYGFESEEQWKPRKRP